jgi:hypothetical protein
MTPEEHTARHEAHMSNVQAVQRRSQYVRCLCLYTQLMTWERMAQTGTAPALTDEQREQMQCLREMRDKLREEMVACNQQP